MKKQLPILYKRTNTGAIQFWEIGVVDSTITTLYGQHGTSFPQQTVDFISQGKNIGRSNATTPHEQAVFEAEAKWLKQKKKGYVENIEDARAGKTDKVIKGGCKPMLATKYADQSHKIVFPCYVQPKLDGIRCIAMVDHGTCTLWTRSQKQINSVPHVAAALAKLYPENSVVLDGELYSHEHKANFSAIVSAVRRDSPSAESELVQYHIYDVIAENMPFKDREQVLSVLAETSKEACIQVVDSVLAGSEPTLLDQFERFKGLGYEGAMARNEHGLYEAGKRSQHLQKLKEFEADEFPIVGIKEGRGRLTGHVGSFVCQQPNGETFDVKLKGDTFYLKHCFEEHSEWEGQQMTVQYQGFGSNGRPRFPVGVAIRSYE